MGLFRRKAIVEDEGERCPRCIERVPEGASECAMCEADLRPLRSLAASPRVAQARDVGAHGRGFPPRPS